MPYDLIEETDTLDAASVNDRFTTLAGLVNSVGAPAIQERGLSKDNIAGRLIARDLEEPFQRAFTPADYVTYTNEYPGWNVDTEGVSPGWLVVHNGAGTELQEEFAAPIVFGDDTDDRVGVIFVQCSVERVVHIRATGTYAYPQARLEATRIALQYKDSSNVWQTLPHTERGLAPDLGNHEVPNSADLAQLTTNTHASLDYAGIIRAADCTGSEIRGVRVVACVAPRDGGTAQTGQQADLFRGDLTVIPFHCSYEDALS
jgi:hypothetical protein